MPGSTKLFTDADYPGDPYPGATPDCSFVHLDGVARGLDPDPTRHSGWRVSTDGGRVEDLDDWLAARGAPPLAARVPVLSYGSNRCPSKITWLRRRLGLTGPVVVLDVLTEGVAAVWAAGLRARDGQRPAVLAAAPAVTERHAVWLATPAQVAVLDRCEGRGERYRLARLRTGRVRGADGTVFDRPWCYLGAGPVRAPLLVAGTPVRCAELRQQDARWLSGTAAATDGLDADEVTGAPHPDQWPAALFGYGLLQPGRSGWPLVAPYAAGPGRAAHARGTRYDTGLGWPAMLLGEHPDVPGTLTPLRDPVGLLPALDEYEGPDYRRIRLTLPRDGAVTWAYAWVGDRGRLRATGRGDTPGPTAATNPATGSGINGQPFGVQPREIKR
ncbi:MAG TPA: gamma-glutamylcyclotransferase family protein [Pseudonocardia sp.]|nr:gamma-glutamylcyclotransferase family protein [Pseudonocardia sp.]